MCEDGQKGPAAQREGTEEPANLPTSSGTVVTTGSGCLASKQKDPSHRLCQRGGAPPHGADRVHAPHAQC